MLSHLKDLAERTYRANVYTFSDFLAMADLSDFYKAAAEFKHVPYTVWGGNEACERKMVRFGDESTLGYEEDFPIVALSIKPVIEKFSDELNHRDYLGSLMNLGIERDVLGDIFVKENSAILFVKDSMADYIIENLVKIRHTMVRVSQIEDIGALTVSERKEMSVSVASERIDGVIAKVYNLSRSESAEMFVTGKIFLNGRLMENESRKLVPGDVVSVRGYGKFEFIELGGLSRKGKQYVKVSMYI